MYKILVFLLTFSMVLVNFYRQEGDNEGLTSVIKNDSTLVREIMLDKEMIQTQMDLLIRDSAMTVYLINQLEFRPNLARRMIRNLGRHFYLDSIDVNHALERIDQYEFIDCCL